MKTIKYLFGIILGIILIILVKYTSFEVVIIAYLSYSIVDKIWKEEFDENNN